MKSIKQKSIVTLVFSFPEDHETSQMLCLSTLHGIKTSCHHTFKFPTPHVCRSYTVVPIMAFVSRKQKQEKHDVVIAPENLSERRLRWMGACWVDKGVTCNYDHGLFLTVTTSTLCLNLTNSKFILDGTVSSRQKECQLRKQNDKQPIV